MKVVIPVAGIGTRLRPHTYAAPKPLLYVAGKPILAHLLDPIQDLKPEEVRFVIGYKGEQIKQFVEENYDFNCAWIQQDELLGLGFALNLAIKEMDNSDLLVVLGDTIVDTDLRQFVDAGDYVLGVRKVDDPKRFGIAETEDGVVTHLEEKPEHPKNDLAIIGLYYFNESEKIKEALNRHVDSGKTTRGEIQLTDALELMIQDGVRFRAHEVKEWYDCGKKETMIETNRHILAGRDETPEVDGSVVIPPVHIADSAKVTNSIIGPNVSIAEGATVERAVVRESIINRDAIVRDVVLEHSIIGQNAEYTGGVRRLNIGDNSEVTLSE